MGNIAGMTVLCRIKISVVPVKIDVLSRELFGFSRLQRQAWYTCRENCLNLQECRLIPSPSSPSHGSLYCLICCITKSPNHVGQKYKPCDETLLTEVMFLRSFKEFRASIDQVYGPKCKLDFKWLYQFPSAKPRLCWFTLITKSSSVSNKEKRDYTISSSSNVLAAIWLMIHFQPDCVYTNQIVNIRKDSL